MAGRDIGVRGTGRRLSLSDTCIPRTGGTQYQVNARCMSASSVRGLPQRREFQLLKKILELLHISSPNGERFEEEDFRGKNAAVTVRHVLHGLYNAYDKKTAQKKLKNVWPVKPGETDKEFRGAIASWITTLQENHSDSPFLQGFSAALLLRPGTPQCSMFLSGLSMFVLQDRLKDKLELAGDAVPLHVLKFATQQDKSGRVALRRELAALEAENIELERQHKEWLPDKCLSLQHMSLSMESSMPNESADELTKIHKELREQNELIQTRIAQIEEQCALQDGLFPIDLVGGLKKCNEFCSKFLQGYDKKACEEMHLNAAMASMHMNSIKKSLERIHEQRKILEEMLQKLKQRACDICASLNLGTAEKPLKMNTGSRRRAPINVEDFVEQLAAAYNSHNTP